MKVLITGGAGFVGSQLGQRLHQAGHNVILLDNMRFGHLDNLLLDGAPFGRFICADIRDPDFIRHCDGVEAIFHFAGIAALPVCQEDPQEAYAVNTGGVGNVLEAARRAGVGRVVFSSTSAVYENSGGDRLAEDTPVAPDLVYACTKAAAEDLCAGYAASYGMDIITCRFFNVYGPHQDVTRTSPPFTSYVARELVLDRSPRLFNNSDVARDYVHVDDVVDLLIRMMSAEGSFAAERFNVCSGQGYSVPELYEHFLAVSGKEVAATYGDAEQFWNLYPKLFEGPYPLSRERVKKEVYKRAVGDPSRARDRFGWTASTDIREGVASVYHDAARRLGVGGGG